MSTQEFDKRFFNFSVPIETISTSNESGEEVRTFEGLAYSGAVIPRHFIFENLFIDLDSLKAKSQIPILRDHTSREIAGYGSLYKDNENKLRVSGRVSKNAHGSEISLLADEGFKWELSVGAVPEYIEDVPKGKSVSVNGTTTDEGAMIFRHSRIIEVSFVAIGADSNTNANVFSSEEQDDNEELETITVEVRQMENDIKPVEQVAEQADTAEVTAPEVKIDETAAVEVKEEIEATQADLQLTVDRLTAELACSCEEKKEAKSDLEKANDKIKELEKELSSMKSQKKKEEFSSKAQELGLKLSQDQVDFFHAELSEDDKFDKVLAILSDQATNARPVLPADLMKQQTVEAAFASAPVSDHKDIKAKAKALVAKLAEQGKKISFTEAVEKVSSWSM